MTFSFKQKAFSILVLFMFLNINLFAFANQIDIAEQRSEVQQKINSLTRLERQETNKLNRNQQTLEKKEKDLQKTQAQLNAKKEDISELQKELNSYLSQYNKRQNASAERIRTIYKMKNTLVLDLLISTTSISQFLDRIYYQNLIIQADKKKMRLLKTEARKVAVVKQKLEYERKRLTKIEKNIDKERKSIEKTIRQNKKMIDKFQKDRRAYERAERELERQSNNLATMISKTTKDSGVVVTGGFLMPVTGKISSPYGEREHPIFKSKKMHTGIDIAAAMGTPIKASNAGKVIYSGWYGGYGRVVILDHGSCTGLPTTTLYAHMSRQKVVVGQNVVRGQVIGLVGSTGYSTGPHLHFEVRINGKHQNPRNFL